MTLLLWLLTATALWWGVGPWGLMGWIVVTLAVPRVRRGLRPTVRRVLALGTVVAAGCLVVALIPDGRLPLPPGAGLLVSPAYVGGAVAPEPIEAAVPQHPFLAPNGASSMHADGWATDSYPWPGPLGSSPDVDTAWYGIEECATIALDSEGDLIALCGGVRGPALHVLDAESMTKRASLDLPGRAGDRDVPPWRDLCGGAYFYLDHQDRAVVATTDRRILVVTTHGADGRAALAVATSYDLTDQVPSSDCLLALMPDWGGRIWFVTEGGRVGWLDPGTGHVEDRDLREPVANSLAADRRGVYVVTDAALYRLTAAAGQVRVAWRASYDRGSGTKPGQLSGGSGTTPTVLPGGLVVITDNAVPRMHVVAYRTRDGTHVCSVPVFAAGRSATENSLVSLGDAVVVENNYGYRSPLSTTVGRATAPGLARVDIARTGCSVAWTSAEVAPSSVPKVSLATGLVYAYTVRPSRWLVSAWYLTAIDARTGRTAFSVRTGTGILANNNYAAIYLTPDGSAYVATLGGLVRVRDG